VNLGHKKVTIKVANCAGVLAGDNGRQLNRYRYKLDRPRVSLESLLEGHRDRMRALARVAANPRSWWANYAFRQKLSANQGRTNDRILFSDISRGPSTRISAHVDEYGGLVVESSRGVTTGDHITQRNHFSYRTAGQELPLEQMLHDRPDLVRTLAVAVRYPDNAAVRRTFTRQVSCEYIRGHEPSLTILNLNWASPGLLLVEYGAGVTVGTGTTRTDRVSLKLGRVVMTGWDSPVKKIAEEIRQPAVIEPVGPAVSPRAPSAYSERPSANVSRSAVTRSSASSASNRTLSSPFSRRMHV
jgi:hypothetical protein